MERQTINSGSHIKSAGYDESAQKAHVEFSGGSVYEYDNVTPDEWSAFSATFDDEDASTGQALNRLFKNDDHPARKI